MRQPFPQTPMSEEDKKLAAATVELARQQGKNLDKAVLMIELRKWCIEKGVEGMKSSPVWFNDKTNETRFYALELAQEFYKFVAEPLAE